MKTSQFTMFKNFKCRTLFLKVSQARSSSVQAASKPLPIEEPVNQTEVEWNQAKPFSEIPGSATLPFLFNFFPGGKYHKTSAIDFFKSLNKEYGDLVRINGMLGRPRQVVAFHADIFRKVFQNEGPWPERPGIDTFAYFREHMRPDVFQNLGGLVTDSGERWAYMRKITNPLMMKPAIVMQYVPKIDEVAADFIDRIRKIRDPETLEMPKNFRQELARWSLESVAVIGLNTRLGLFNPSPENEMGERFIGSVRRFFELVFRLDLRPSIWKYYKTKQFKEIMEVYNTMTDCTLHYVNAAKAELERNPSADDNSILVQIMKTDPRAAVVMVHDMLFAGVDTTSFTIANLMYALAKNPDKQEILRKEAMKVLPNKDSKVTESSLKHLPYTRSVLKETLRMYNVVMSFTRRVAEDTVIAGYQVPKGTVALLPHLLLSNDSTNFPSAEKFLPERWMREDNDEVQACPHAKSQHPYSYIPFGYGVRMCVGKRIAQMEMETLVLKLMRNFKVEWNYDDMKYQSEMLYIPASDLRFTLREI